jgi:hypothetical protein
MQQSVKVDGPVISFNDFCAMCTKALRGQCLSMVCIVLSKISIHCHESLPSSRSLHQDRRYLNVAGLTASKSRRVPSDVHSVALFRLSFLIVFDVAGALRRRKRQPTSRKVSRDFVSKAASAQAPAKPPQPIVEE